jgi:pyridoxal phosphate enzyme (YggS family)
MPAAPAAAARLAGVRERISAAAGRAGRGASDVRLIAVTKGVDPSRIEEVIAAGVGDIGENRAQEARRKRDAVLRPATWHMLGHVQSNKAAAVADLFDVVHSIDSDRILRMLADRRSPAHAPLTVLIEVELTGIPGRSGVSETALPSLVRSAEGVSNVNLAGLMTIAPPVQYAADARPFFQRLRRLRDSAQESTGRALPELSMGMSDDFEVAVEEGATLVRIGRAIFGARP